MTAFLGYIFSLIWLNYILNYKISKLFQLNNNNKLNNLLLNYYNYKDISNNYKNNNNTINYKNNNSNKNNNINNNNNWNNNKFNDEKSTSSKIDLLTKLSLNPLLIFKDLDLKETQIKMKEIFKNKGGVYMIINLVNDKFYIGSAIKNRLYIRFSSHLIHLIGSDLVAKAVNKYGLKNFAFIILEFIELPITKKSNAVLLELETKYLQELNPPYNILKIGGSSFGFKHSEETKKKMKENYSEKRKDFIHHLNKGKVMTEEVREKLRAAAFFRPRLSELSKLKCGLSNAKKVYAYNLDGTLYRSEESIKNLALFLQCSRKTIQRRLKDGKELKGKWIIKHIN